MEENNEHPIEKSEWLQFTVGSRVVALGLTLCMETLLAPIVSPVPLSPRALVGLISLRGVTIPVVQIDTMVGNRDFSKYSSVIISQLGKQVIGIAGTELRSIELDKTSLSLHPERNVFPCFEQVTPDGVALLHPERLAAVIRKTVRFPM